MVAATGFANTASTFHVYPGQQGARANHHEVYHSPPCTQRVFVQAPYDPDDHGKVGCRVPEVCPRGEPGSSCRVRVHHFRERKTGPRFPLAVARCRTHPKPAFTLYPPGHVPYGRVAVAPARLDGGGLLTEAGTKAPAWGQTVFAAAKAAAEGERWDRLGEMKDGTREAPAHCRTLGRHLELAGMLIGVHAMLPARTRERVARELDVPAGVLHDAAVESSLTRSWTVHGKVIVKTLAGLAATRALPDRILDSGAHAGLWPDLLRWRPQRGILERSRAPVRRTASSPHGPDPPSTTSRL